MRSDQKVRQKPSRRTSPGLPPPLGILGKRSSCFTPNGVIQSEIYHDMRLYKKPIHKTHSYLSMSKQFAINRSADHQTTFEISPSQQPGNL